MDSFSKSVYASEVWTQCRFALDAIDHLNDALELLRSPPDPRQASLFRSEVFRAIHSFLAHTSNVSLLLWPPLPKRGNGESVKAYERRLATKQPVIRSRALRAEFGLPDEHLLKNRRLRDHLEHFDERLDEWRCTSGVHKNFCNDYIGAAEGTVGLKTTEIMRWFDPSTRSFTFGGEMFDLQALATAVDQLLPLAHHVQTTCWERMMQEAKDNPSTA